MEQPETTDRVAPAEPPQVLPLGQRRVIWGLLLGLTLLGTALLWPASQWSGPDEQLGMILWNCFWTGGMLALATVVMVWAVLADRPLTVRGPRALGFLGLQLWCLVWGLRHSAVPAGDTTLFACTALVLLVVQGILLEMLRWPVRWRLELAGQAADSARSQFTVRQALLWTAGAAVLLALAKSVPPDASRLKDDAFLPVLMPPLVLLAITLPTALASLGMILGRSRRFVRTLVTGFLLLATAAILTALMIHMQPPFRATMSMVQQILMYAFPLFFLGGFVLVFWGTLAILRLCGYRLARRPKGQDARGTSDEPEGGCPFAIAGPQSRRRSPFAYLVAGLVLVGLGMTLAAAWLEGPRREARAKLVRREAEQALTQPWMDLDVSVSFSEGRIVYVAFQPGRLISEKALRKLAEVEELYHRQTPSPNSPGVPIFPPLSCAGSQVTDEQLRYLRELPSLVMLDLSNTKIGDAGLAHLEGLEQLQSLNLSGTAVSDAGMASLRRLPVLSQVSLQGTAVTAAGLAQLQGAPRLVSVQMPKTITDADLAQLQGLLEQLHTVDLTGTQVTDASMAVLGRLPKLGELHLRGTAVTAAGLAQLQGCPHLSSLTMPKTITDADLAPLEKLLEPLVSLDLSGTQVTDAGMATLAGMKHLSQLTLTDTAVTDAGLARLESCSQLTQLAIGPRVSRAAVLRWKQARPDRAGLYQATAGGSSEYLP